MSGEQKTVYGVDTGSLYEGGRTISKLWTDKESAKKEMLIVLDKVKSENSYRTAGAIGYENYEGWKEEMENYWADGYDYVTICEYNLVDPESAALKEVIRELIPIAEERLRRIVNYDMPDYYKVTGGIKAAIDRAEKLIAENKTE